MVTTTLVSAGLPVSGRMVNRSINQPMTMPATIAASSPTTPGRPSLTDTW
jgi:hypothetical protein